MQSTSMIAILILTAFLAVVVAMIMSVVAVAVCVAYIHRDKPDEELQEAYDNAKAMETEALAIVDHHQEESEAVAKNAADKIRRAAAEAYAFGMAVCTEIITARNLPATALPQWDATKFYNHRLSHEIDVCRDNPNMSGALLEKAVDARVRDDLWHWAPKSSAPLPVIYGTRDDGTYGKMPLYPGGEYDHEPPPDNVTRKLGKPEWRDINPNEDWPVKPNENDDHTQPFMCLLPGCNEHRLSITPYCKRHTKMSDDQRNAEVGEYANILNGVEPRKPVDAREAMLFGDTKE